MHSKNTNKPRTLCLLSGVVKPAEHTLAKNLQEETVIIGCSPYFSKSPKTDWLGPEGYVLILTFLLKCVP